MGLENIKFEKDEVAAIITVNRPDVLNALNARTIDELAEVLEEVRVDDGILGVIVTGMGDKSFVAGADINELAASTPQSGKETCLHGQAVLASLERLGKPVIAAVNGYALGGGLELALACHIRVASENARLGLPEVGLGIIPGYGGTQRLPRLVGTGRALEIILAGKSITADEAYRFGLVNRVVPEGEALTAAKEILGEIGAKGPLAVKNALEAVYSGMDMPIGEGMKMEANLFGLLCATKDMEEGMSAFLEKRQPDFKGE